MTLVLIVPGVFTMGSPNDTAPREADERQQQVAITRPFYLGAFEVTVGQYRRFVEETGYRTARERDPELAKISVPDFLAEQAPYDWRKPGFPQGDRHPVVNVSWNDAAEFCRWLSRKESRDYRLPTEAEWEYACRAGTSTRYSFGQSEREPGVAGNFRDVSTTGLAFPVRNDRYRFTAPVGSFPPNAFGLYDMHGNVCEWCADWYEAEHGRCAQAADPRGPSSGSERVLRGGSWSLIQDHARSANRLKYSPGFSQQDLGFRVARTVLKAPLATALPARR